jgi:hypothetical protein
VKVDSHSQAFTPRTRDALGAVRLHPQSSSNRALAWRDSSSVRASARPRRNGRRSGEVNRQDAESAKPDLDYESGLDLAAFGVLAVRLLERSVNRRAAESAKPDLDYESGLDLAAFGVLAVRLLERSVKRRFRRSSQRARLQFELCLAVDELPKFAKESKDRARDFTSSREGGAPHQHSTDSARSKRPPVRHRDPHQ